MSKASDDELSEPKSEPLTDEERLALAWAEMEAFRVKGYSVQFEGAYKRYMRMQLGDDWGRGY